MSPEVQSGVPRWGAARRRRPWPGPEETLWGQSGSEARHIDRHRWHGLQCGGTGGGGVAAKTGSIRLTQCWKNFLPFLLTRRCRPMHSMSVYSASLLGLPWSWEGKASMARLLKGKRFTVGPPFVGRNLKVFWGPVREM